MATARNGTFAVPANFPRPAAASAASAEERRPTWSCPVTRRLTTSRGVRANAGTALLSGQRAATADATATAASKAPGRPSSTTTTRCFARYAYHCLYGEWPGNRTAATPRRARTGSLPLTLAAVVEDVELEEVGDHVVRHVDEVADPQVAGDAAEQVRLHRIQLARRRRRRSGDDPDHLQQRVAGGERHILRLVPER